MRLSHSKKLRGLLLSAVTVRCITLQRRLRSTDTSGKAPIGIGRPWNLKFDIFLLIF